MICPVVTYAPTAATKPSIAAHPLNLSASGVMIVYLLCVKCVIVNCEMIFISRILRFHRRKSFLTKCMKRILLLNQALLVFH